MTPGNPIKATARYAIRVRVYRPGLAASRAGNAYKRIPLAVHAVAAPTLATAPPAPQALATATSA
jgi:hypothetical protein